MAPGDHLESLFEVILAPKSVIVPQKTSHKALKRHLKNSINKKGEQKFMQAMRPLGLCSPLRLNKPGPDPDPDPGPGPQNQPRKL